MIYHVSIHGCDRAAGTADAPLRTISRAAELALPGDTVRIHAGTYREWVKPACPGLSDVRRITFEAAPGDKPVIKGSEIVTGWTRLDDGLWTASVPNSLFPDVNPFAEAVWGDWLLEPVEQPRHTGEVYLNGKSLYEAATLAECAEARKREVSLQPPWDPRPIPHPHQEETAYQWYAEVTPEETVFYLNCQESDPNDALVEITVRRACFYPTRRGVNYITVRGLEMCQCATPYHFPHTTQVAGCIFVYGGDDRLYNNLFAGQSEVPEKFFGGCSGYDFCNTAEDYPRLLAAEGNTDEAKFAKVMQPVYVGGNVYCGSARPFRAEQAPNVLKEAMPVQVTMEDSRAVLHISLPEEAVCAGVPVSTQSLGMPRVPEAPFDNPDGTPVNFAPDMLGVRRIDVQPGPIAGLRAGENTMVVWQ